MQCLQLSIHQSETEETTRKKNSHKLKSNGVITQGGLGIHFKRIDLNYG